ncbi:ABC transporter ATP-binding protein [Martelella alba]|uniref:ATP-binding cassette domain-containing protein n=1 Tax=Martelella alba TaxID=2590451 RepID=A0ABY2ST05_9HYPH|nr:ATP-binding cassette domain-containing protein [Martelella alba]TKI07406.1 ATP-binding cassette domain-containing protein [Martelella alba]
MLRLQKINQFYGAKHILRDISLTLPRSQCTYLLGRNGVGKTSLVNTIMGHVPAAGGAISWQPDGQDELDLLRYPVEARASLGIGYVPQGAQVFSQLSVDENLRVALLAGRNKVQQIPPMIHELFPTLYDMRQQRAGELVGSVQQQLAIARALVLKPELLILDEPAGTFPATVVAQTGRILRRLQREFGLTLLVAEQQLPFAPADGDRFCLLEGGCNVAQGALAQLDEELIQTYLVV